MEFVKHENTWPWGESTIIITSDGCGTITVQFDKFFEDEAFITSLSVHKSKRNKGYGSTLLKEAERYALERGMKKVALRADKNNWVYDWYIRNGYKKDGFMVSLDDNDELCTILKKDLS